jgi:hypothetical protein
MDTVDNRGFDNFDMEIWIDHRSGFTRLVIEYPDGSTYSSKGQRPNGNEPGAAEPTWAAVPAAANR